MHPILKGSLKSVTMWAAGVVALASYVSPVLTPDALLELGLQPHTVKVMGILGALLMGCCRFITNSSLADKGAAPTSTDNQTQGKSI